MTKPIEGRVARLVTDEELILNIGGRDGVTVDMDFVIVDPRTQDISDPITGEGLGSISRHKATVRVYRVTERLALARNVKRHGISAISAISAALAGYEGPGTLTGSTWPNGVDVGDPARQLPPGE